MLVDGAGSDARVVAIDARTSALGVRVGATLFEAQARDPSLTTAVLDRGRLEAVHARIVGALQGLSSRLGVWWDAPATGTAAIAPVPGFLVDFDDDVALARIVEAVRELDFGPVAIGVADGAFASACAARVVEVTGDEPKVRSISVGGDVAFLRGLSATLLPASPEARDALHALGMRTLGEVAALPIDGAHARLGEEGRRLVRLARGEKVAALAAQQVDGEPTASVDLRDEHGGGAESLDAITFALRVACARLVASIVARGAAVTEVEVTLLTAKSPVRLRVRLPQAVIDAQTLFERARETIEAAHVRFGASSETGNGLDFKRETSIEPVTQLRATATMCVALEGTRARLARAPSDATIVRLDVALARLRGRFGTANVVTPIPYDDRHFEAPGEFVPANTKRVHEAAPATAPLHDLELRERLRAPSMSIGSVVVSRAPEVGDAWPIRSVVAGRTSPKRETIVAVESDAAFGALRGASEESGDRRRTHARWIVGSHGVRALFVSGDGVGAWRLVGVAD